MGSATILDKKTAWLENRPVWLSTGEIAAYYGKSPKAVYYWMRRGLRKGRLHLRFQWIGGERKSTPEWCEEFMAELNASKSAVAEPVRTVDAQARREQREAARTLGSKRRL